MWKSRDRCKGRLPAIAAGNAKVACGKISNQTVEFPMFQIYSFSTFTRGGRKMYFYCYLFPKTSLSFYLLDDKREGTRNKDTQYTFFFLCFLIFPWPQPHVSYKNVSYKKTRVAVLLTSFDFVTKTRIYNSLFSWFCFVCINMKYLVFSFVCFGVKRGT